MSATSHPMAPPPAAMLTPSGMGPTGRKQFVDWVDGAPTSPNEWTDINDRRDFGEYTLPSVLEFGHDAAIIRLFGRSQQVPYGLAKCDWEAWYRQLCRAIHDLWLSCWCVTGDGIDVDLVPFFGSHCCTEGNEGENMLLWVIRHQVEQVAAIEGWASDPVIAEWTVSRHAALAKHNIKEVDPEWSAAHLQYRALLKQVDLRQPWDPASTVAVQIAECQDRLALREQQLGYRGWLPAQNLAPYSLKGFFDDSFWIALDKPFQAIFRIILQLRQRHIRSQDKKLDARLFGYAAPLVIDPNQEVATAHSRPLLRQHGRWPVQPCVAITLSLRADSVDVLGTEIDTGDRGELFNGPARLARITASIDTLRTAANNPKNHHRLVNFKHFRAFVSFVTFCVRFWPAARPALLRAYRAVFARGALVFGKCPHPLRVASDLESLPRLFAQANSVALQPRHGALSAALGDEYSILHHDAAGAPDGGAEVFYTLHPEGFRGGGSYLTVPGQPTRLFMTKFVAALLDNLSSCVSEYCNANAHLDASLPFASRTVLEVLDNNGTSKAIVALKGHIPRMAECSLWRSEIMLRHRKRVVTVHRLRFHLEAADMLSKGKLDEAQADILGRGLGPLALDVLSASLDSIKRIMHILALPAHSDDDLVCE